MNTFDSVRLSVKDEMSSARTSLPPLLEPTVALFRKAHVYFAASKLVKASNQAIADPFYGNPVVYGAALHMAADYTCLKIALNVALIAKCTQDLLREYRSVSDSYQNLKYAMRWQYPVYHTSQQRGQRNQVLLPSFYLRWLNGMIQFVHQVIRVLKCSKNLLVQTFHLSMRLNDAYLILNGDPAARFVGYTELVSEWSRYLYELQEDKNRLLELINSESNSLNKIVSRIMNNEKSEAIMKFFKEKLEKAGRNEEWWGEQFPNFWQEALDPVLVRGKVTSMRFQVSQGRKAGPLVPTGKFAPWGGGDC